MFAMKYYERPDFKALNAHWRDKLERAGFDDLEDASGNITPLTRELNRDPRVDKSSHYFENLEFYLQLDAWLQTKPKLSRKHRNVLELYAMGTEVTTIAIRKHLSCSMVHRIVRAARRAIFGV